MNFVDRIAETNRLQKLLQAEKPCFIIVRGRRRLGKSTLIKRVLTEQDIYYEADKTEATNQWAQIATMAAQVFPGLNDVTYTSWESLLMAINYRVQERITLCLDEFPYLVDVSPDLPSVIQKLLDSGTLKYNLILCGSSQRMMYNLLYDAQSPLYGRSSADFKLNPIRLPYLQEALHLNADDTIVEYAIWGGVPRYWVLRETNENVDEALKEHVLSNQGLLYEEPQHLFRDDMTDIVKVSTIMTIVGNGANRLFEIAGRLQETATNLSRPLAKLVDLGYLQRDIPFGESLKKTKKTLYRIADPFLSFHYRFVAPNRSFIELERIAPIQAQLDEQLNAHIGYWWEKICRDAVTGNKIDGITYGEAKRWWGNVVIEGVPQNVELDVVAESVDHRTILIGECKWTNGENAEMLTNRLAKIATALPFTRRKKIVYKLFLRQIPTHSLNNHLLPDDVIELSR